MAHTLQLVVDVQLGGHHKETKLGEREREGERDIYRERERGRDIGWVRL